MNAEPKPHERRYLRHRFTGDRGYIVISDGEMMVQYDRGPQAPKVKYKENDWADDTMSSSMTTMQIAEIAYLTVSRYYYYSGQHAKAKRPWLALTEEERIYWMGHGPKDPTAKKFFDAVMAAGSELT